MKGNNLFDGLNSGGVGKYKKVGDEAARRERAEKLDEQIARLNGQKKDYEWAKTALNFVEEQTKLNSDVFDISVNAVLLKQIKTEAQYIIDKKKAEDEARLKKEQAEKEEADRKKREEELKKKKEEEERRRLEEKKKQEAERLAKEKEERWENDTAESTDKLIIDLSLAPKSLFWCEDVKNAQNLVKSLSVKVRAKCKQLDLLSELALTSRKVSDAAVADEFILQLEADCKRDEKNYSQIKEAEKIITDSCRPYMKEYEKYKVLRDEAAEYDRKQKKLAEEKAKEQREKAEKIAKEAAELDALRKKAAEFDAKIDALEKKAATAKLKKNASDTLVLESVYAAATELLNSIQDKYAPLIKKYKVLVNLDNEGKAYFEEKVENERLAVLAEKAKIEEEKKRAAEIDGLLIEIDVAKRIKQTYDEIAKLEKEVTPRMRTFLKNRELFDKLTDEAAKYFEKIAKEAKAAEEKARKAETEKREKERKKAIAKAKRGERLLYVIPLLATIVLLAAAFAVSYFVPDMKTLAFYSVLGVLLVCSFIPYFMKFRGYAAPVVYVYQFLVLSGLCVTTFFLANNFFTVSVALCVTVFAFIMSTAFRRWIKFLFTVLFSAGLIVSTNLILEMLGVPFSGVIVASVVAFVYALLTMRVFALSRKAKAVEVITYIVNGFMAVASIVFTAIGAGSAVSGTVATESCLGIVFGLGSLLSFVMMSSFFYDKYSHLGLDGLMIICGFVAIITLISFAVALDTAGDGKTPFMLIVGIGTIVSFLPFYICTYIRIAREYCGSEDLLLEKWFLVLISLSSLIMALVSCNNFSGRMLIFNSGLLFNGLVSVVTLFILTGIDMDDVDSFLILLGVAISILFCVACPITIVHSIERFNETFGSVAPSVTPEAAAFVGKISKIVFRR